MTKAEMQKRIDRLQAALEDKDAELEAYSAAHDQHEREWRTWGVVEISLRNPNVCSFVQEWTPRAMNAERKLREIADQLRDPTPAEKRAMMGFSAAEAILDFLAGRREKYGVEAR